MRVTGALGPEDKAWSPTKERRLIGVCKDRLEKQNQKTSPQQKEERICLLQSSCSLVGEKSTINCSLLWIYNPNLYYLNKRLMLRRSQLTVLPDWQYLSEDYSDSSPGLCHVCFLIASNVL